MSQWATAEALPHDGTGHSWSYLAVSSAANPKFVVDAISAMKS
jgi:hypothetical protein